MTFEPMGWGDRWRRASGRLFGLAVVGSIAIGTTAMAQTAEPARRFERLKLLPVAGLHVGGPVRASFTSGLAWASTAPGEPIRAFVFVEPGLRGGRLSIATGSSVGSLASAWTVRATMLQLWAGAPHKRYAGVELQLIAALGLGGRIGAFRPLSGSARKILWIGDFSFLL